MSSYARLTLGSLHLGSTRNDIDPGLIWLFVRPRSTLGFLTIVEESN